MFSRDEYFVYILLSIQIHLVVDKVHIAVVGDASYTVTDIRPTTNVGMRCSPDWGVHQLIKPFTDDSPYLFHGRTTHHCTLTVYLSAVSNELWPTLVFFVCDTCISVLQCVFRTCPIFGSHWTVTRLRNFIKSGIYVANHFAFMFIISQVDRQSVSIRFFVFEKESYYLWTGVYNTMAADESGRQGVSASKAVIRSRDYVYGIWQYKILNIKNI